MIAHLNQGAGLMKPETARQMHDFLLPIAAAAAQHGARFLP